MPAIIIDKIGQTTHEEVIMKYIITASILILYTTNAFPQQTCETNDTNESTRIYFANGMSNDPKDASESSLKISDLLYGSPTYAYRTSYNANENWLTQLLQVYQQKKLDQKLEVQSEEYWYWLRNMEEAPQWFQAVYNDSMDEFQESDVYNDPYLVSHVNNYLQDLYNGKKVVIVAHSQGNFYANNAYRRILDEHPEYRDNIGIVGVATPASSVLGWNNDNAAYPYGLYYTTNASDLVINLVRAFYPETLPPNPSQGYSTGFLGANHGFVDTYLDQNGPFRNRIRDHILQTINMIETPEEAPECADVVVETLDASNISSTSAQMFGRVVSGKDVYVQFIHKQESTPTTLSCDDLIMPESGTFKAGDQYYSTVLLAPDTTYYFRTCGRSGDKISSGAIKTFHTPKPSVPCGNSLKASGGTNGLDMLYSMGSQGGYVLVEFEAYEIPDKLEVWHGGTRILNTPGYVSDCNYGTVYHNPSKGYEWNIKVFGNSISSTAWVLHISCPSDSKPTEEDFTLCSP